MSRISDIKPAMANRVRKATAELIAELEERILGQDSELVITRMRTLTALMGYTAESPDVNPDELARVALLMNTLIDQLELSLARESAADH